VARLADLSLNTVVKIESGVNQNPTIDTLSKIAKALEVKVDDLIQK
jgi:transcriptional regulator with XRE-family HTH domain